MVKFSITILSNDDMMFLGVDDGQFGKIIAHEIPLIREAFNRKYYSLLMNYIFSRSKVCMVINQIIHF